MYCNDGWGHLLIVMEGNPKAGLEPAALWESRHPSSPHYYDQAKLHSQRQAKQFWLTPADILQHTESVWGDLGPDNTSISSDPDSAPPCRLRWHSTAPG